MTQNTGGSAEHTPTGAKTVPPKKKNNKTLIIVLVVVIFLFALPGIIIGGAIFWLSRGDNAEKVAESVIEQTTDSEVDINTEDGEFSIQTEEGDLSVGGDQELPDDYPSEATVFSPQQITGSYSQNNDTDSAWYISASTDSSIDEVYSFFQNAYSGWNQVSTATYNETRTVNYEKEDLSVLITITSLDGKTEISYTVTQDTQ